jgi:xanthine dehydrogenase YagR molybdenum-binding subunit
MTGTKIGCDMGACGAATVRLLADGSAIVRSGTQDIGTGTYTIMAQVAADALALPVARVTAELGDSAMSQAPVSGGSQTATSVMPAVHAAARDVRDQLVALAINAAGGKLGGARPDDVDIADGALFLTSDPSRREAIGIVLSRADHEAIEATRDAKPAPDAKKYGMHAFGAHFAEVRVDAELGEVRVTRYVGAFAAGRILNPKTARSQAIGGIVYGLGMALTEETHVDRRSGRVVNANMPSISCR